MHLHPEFVSAMNRSNFNPIEFEGVEGQASLTTESLHMLR